MTLTYFIKTVGGFLNYSVKFRVPTDSKVKLAKMKTKY